MRACSRSSTIISMYKKICITNRHLVQGDFLRQIEKAAAAKPDALILREKDLSQEAYARLAVKVMAICREEGVPCFFNGWPELAAELGAHGVQLPLKSAEALEGEGLAKLPCFGVSVHSEEEAVKAEKIGAAFILYGHVFATDCKKGVPPRGLDALARVCRCVSIPVFAIGGIHPQNAEQCIAAGAWGVGMMSEYME